MQPQANTALWGLPVKAGYAMTGVRLSLRALRNLHLYSRICQNPGVFTYGPLQCSTCWTHQRFFSKCFTHHRLSANGWLYTISSSLVTPLSANTCVLNSVRHKSKKSKKKDRLGTTEEEEEDEEEVDAEDASDYEDEPVEDPTIPKDYKDVERAVQSFRFDVVFTAGLDLSRHKVEEAFYNGQLRLNGEKLWKKSRAVKVGDVLDLIVEENRETASTTVMRTILKEVLKEKTSTDKYKVVLRRWKKLTLPKATEAPKAPA
ncbi:mitochondrial transcription rescue factor 1 [Gastrophryne carolinensis]